MKTRIGLIGCGGIAHVHLEGYRRVLAGRAEVTAVADPDPSRRDAFAERYGIVHRFSSAEALTASGEVDAVAVLTPPAVRAEAIEPALQRRLPVLVEKPFANSLSEAEGYAYAAQEAGVPLAVNQQTRFMPDVQELRRLASAGALGGLRLIVHEHYQDRQQVGGWRAREKRLEISIFSIHLLDRVRWLAGSPPEVVAAWTRAWNPSVAGETFTIVEIGFESGAIGLVVSSWHSLGVPRCTLRLDGTEGSAESRKARLLDDRWTLQVHRLPDSPQRIAGELVRAFPWCMGRSMEELLRAAEAGEEPVHSAWDNLETMAIVDAAYLSAQREGAPVKIEEVWQRSR
ncbi:MAG: oxidoreductase [Candidatus Poribacteria bacterium]|nr:MAG: oxidoreductase [Candidatus Poribacteria bacterium]